ncbi:MAG: diguanylate cyclase [Desulfobulbaceae bacterium]|nr:diguanylate cyclase [Desulfobulbaceae bacterium]
MTPDQKHFVELLRQVLHDKAPPVSLPEDVADQKELCMLYDELIQLRRFIMDVASGDLSGGISLKGYTAGALKTLQANLKHLTWQTQMIASGDFSQRLDFMGDFSQAFNSMTAQLENSIRIIKDKELELSTTNSGLLREIEIRKQTQAALAQSEAYYRNLTETMKDVVWILDTATLRFSYVSPSVQKLRGFTSEEIMAQPMAASLTPESTVYVEERIQKLRDDFLSGKMPADQFYTSEVEQPCKDGTTVWTEVIARFVRNEKTGSVDIHGVTRDISDRRALRMELQRQASIDELTGIYNRRYFLACAEKEIQRCQRHGRALSFLMLDIDHFKLVNDICGHAVGDLALQAVTRAFSELLRSSDSVGRLGGEEFAMILVETNTVNALAVAERIRQQVEQISLTTTSGQPVLLRVSIGVAAYRPESDTLSALMMRADQALYRAKQTGRNRVDCMD